MRASAGGKEGETVMGRFRVGLSNHTSGPTLGAGSVTKIYNYTFRPIKPRQKNITPEHPKTSQGEIKQAGRIAAPANPPTFRATNCLMRK